MITVVMGYCTHHDCTVAAMTCIPPGYEGPLLLILNAASSLITSFADTLPSVQYSTVQYSTVQYRTVQYSTVQYSTVQYSTVQYSTVQYSTVQ